MEAFFLINFMEKGMGGSERKKQGKPADTGSMITRPAENRKCLLGDGEDGERNLGSKAVEIPGPRGLGI